MATNHSKMFRLRSVLDPVDEAALGVVDEAALGVVEEAALGVVAQPLAVSGPGPGE